MKKGRKSKKNNKLKKVTKKYKQRGGGVSQKEYLHKTPGPEQCHPRIGDNRPSEGCIPIDILKKVADKLKIVSNSPH